MGALDLGDGAMTTTVAMKSGERITAAALLGDARAIWDAHPELGAEARRAWRGGFATGAAWMDAARRIPAGRPPRLPKGGLVRRNALGLLKNGGAALLAAGAAAATFMVLAPGVSPWLAALATSAAFVVSFYAIEGQMVFLFPLLDDLEEASAAGGPPPPGVLGLLVACRRWTVRAGGTLGVMRVVMPISARMVFGGLLGMGFLESWCLGCIAVVRWYEEVAR
jgi:hypothetical protein